MRLPKFLLGLALIPMGAVANDDYVDVDAYGKINPVYKDEITAIEGSADPLTRCSEQSGQLSSFMKDMGKNSKTRLLKVQKDYDSTPGSLQKVAKEGPANLSCEDAIDDTRAGYTNAQQAYLDKAKRTRERINEAREDFSVAKQNFDPSRAKKQPAECRQVNSDETGKLKKAYDEEIGALEALEASYRKKANQFSQKIKSIPPVKFCKTNSAKKP